MIALGILINLLFLLLPIFGLYVIVKKETMEIEKNIPAGGRSDEKSQPAFHLFLYLDRSICACEEIGLHTYFFNTLT